MDKLYQNEFSRTEKLIGNKSLEKLNNSHVAIFGVGGVGGYVAESLSRSGIGELTIIDKDEIDITNINRQIIALHSNIGKSKVEVLKNRLLDINPSIKVNFYKIFYNNETQDVLDFSKFSYIVDAIDTITSKLLLIEEAKKLDIPIISSMGAGNKLDPTKFEISDIYKTSVCPMARVMRRELKKRNIKNLKVVYSKEETIKVQNNGEKKVAPGSISFVPSVAGLILSSEVIKDIIT